MLLPDSKLGDRSQALTSVQRLAELSQIEAVLVGDGWQVFHNGHNLLQELIAHHLSD
jgi:hypothetical protein